MFSLLKSPTTICNLSMWILLSVYCVVVVVHFICISLSHILKALDNVKRKECICIHTIGNSRQVIKLQNMYALKLKTADIE